MAVVKKRWLIFFLVLVILVYVLFLRPKPSCNPVSCLAKSKSYCDSNMIVNLTYACMNDECKVLFNKSFDCNTLDKRSCFNQSVVSVQSYSCIEKSCVGSVDIINCIGDESCVDGYCVVTCGNGVIDEGENCVNCPKDVICKENEKCLKGICVPEDWEEKICRVNKDCEDNNPCTVDLCDKQKGKCSNKFLSDKVPSFCCDFDNECDDGNVCTQDVCSRHRCAHNVIEGCCNFDGDCDDNNVCTADSCLDHSCINEYQVALNESCCNRGEDCDDENFCTVDVCVGEGLSRKCMYENIPECCNFAEDCEDEDPCTLDSCRDSKCSHKLVISEESYEVDGYCSEGENASSAYEHCTLDLYSKFFNLEKVFAWCKKDDCLAENLCRKECNIVKPDGKTEFICRAGDWVQR